MNRIDRKALILSSIAGFFLIILSIGGLYLVHRNRSDVICKPYNIFLSKNGDNGIDIEWETKGKCFGYVLYGENSYEIERVAVNTDNLEKDKKHNVSISGLLSTTTYYLIVVSNDSAYGRNGQPIAVLLGDIN